MSSPRKCGSHGKRSWRWYLMGISSFSALITAVPAVYAADDVELLELKHTFLNFVEGMVDSGVLTADQADKLLKSAQLRAKQQAIQDLTERASRQANTADKVESISPTPSVESSPARRVVRVPYVPSFVKDEIRRDVATTVHDKVMVDVEERARREKWGTPDALPEWVNRFTWYGDLRLRLQADRFDDGNQVQSYPDFASINAAGNVNSPDTFLNLTEDRDRLRVRLRFGFNAAISDAVGANVQLATGRDDDPVATMQTLGANFNRYVIAVDRASMSWTARTRMRDEWGSLIGGKFSNPYLATSLVWDPDLSFDGVSGRLTHHFGWDDLAGSTDRSMSLSMVLGGYALTDSEIATDDESSNDKWLLGGQLSFAHLLSARISYKLGLALYDYVNVVGRFNPEGAFGSTRFDWTAPGALQRGNSLFPIKFDAVGNPSLFGLATDFTLVDAFGQVRVNYLDPIAVVLSVEAVRNIGFDESDARARLGTTLKARTNGIQFQLDVGTPIDHLGAWNIQATYRYLQRDAVLDAFTDSEFALGGTDAQGWILGGEFGLSRNTWLALHYLTSNEIDLAPLGIDLIQFDVNARF